MKERSEGRGKTPRVYLGEDDRWGGGDPPHEAIVNRRMMDIAGAAVDTAEKIEAAKAVVEDIMMQDGLIVVSDVDLVRAYRRPHASSWQPIDLRLTKPLDC